MAREKQPTLFLNVAVMATEESSQNKNQMNNILVITTSKGTNINLFLYELLYLSRVESIADGTQTNANVLKFKLL